MNQTRFEWPESPATPQMTALDLLTEFKRRGLVLRAEGNRLECDADNLTPRMRAGLVEHHDALRALIRLRSHAETRRRQIHWFCPDATLFRLWREAERATSQNLTFDGRLSVKPRKKITCRNSAPQDSLF
jgi:hypothetical protein